MPEKSAGGPEIRDPWVAAAVKGMEPFMTAVGAVWLLGSSAEAIVPVVRLLRGRSGVSIGPGLVDLAHGMVAPGVVPFFRQDPARWARADE